ncbi:uncharacterized protein LOC129860210 [Salvelinus fontinalis]|uniref:uncharacterized protein LOC129860210 n=1 Tax=Salvelinus fontinalis TaxID=8038 RepID=UPI00248574D3|nr:uncharacterized protein LOC129860210 [Salvelinus fontinalis]
MKKTRRKWRGLRDRSGSASSGQQPWRFCHILSFLDPCIVPRATSGNFTATPSTTSSTIVVATGASRPSTSPTSATITSTGGVRPSTTSSTSMTTTGAVRPSTTSSTSMTTTGAVRPSTTSSTSMTTTGAVRPSTTSSTSMTTTGAAMEDDEMEEAPLDLGPPEIIMNLTEVTTEDLVEQDVAVERNRERNEEEQCHTRRHRRYQTPDPLNSFQQRLLQAVERDAAQPDAHRKEDEETLFAMNLVPTLKRLPQQRQAAVKVKMYQLLFQAEFNEMESI